MGPLLPNIGSFFPTSLSKHTSTAPGWKGDRPDHSAKMCLAVRPISLKISGTTC